MPKKDVDTMDDSPRRDTTSTLIFCRPPLVPCRARPASSSFRPHHLLLETAWSRNFKLKTWKRGPLGRFYKSRDPFCGVLLRRALLFGVYLRAPDFGKLPFLTSEVPTDAAKGSNGCRLRRLPVQGLHLDLIPGKIVSWPLFWVRR